MALSPIDIDIELAKGTLGRVGKKLSSLNSPPATVAPNIYGATTSAQPPEVKVQTPPQQQPQQLGTPQQITNRPPLLSAQAPGSPVTDNLERPRQFQVGNTSPGNPVTQLKGGANLTHDAEGNRTYTMGTPGQDGYAKATVSRDFDVTNRNVGQPIPQLSPRMSLGRAPVQQDPSIRSPLEISIAARDEINGKTQTLGSPKYLSKEEGAAMGLGWKGRMAKYKEDIDAFNKASGEKTALDIESMREKGAGNRALLHAEGVNDANAIARERMGGELELNKSRIGTEKVDQQVKQLGIDAAKRMEAVQQAYINEQDPIKKRELGKQWLTLQGKDAGKFQIVSKKGVAADGITPTETSYAVNPDNPSESFEIGGKPSQNFDVLPQDITKRKPGSRYTIPDGRIVEWDGKGAKLVQQ